MEKKEIEKYRPSNGSEGDWFIAKYCMNCIHEKFSHTMDHNDKKCEILSASLLFDINDPEYPNEWVYDNDKPICTKFQPTPPAGQ